MKKNLIRVLIGGLLVLMMVSAGVLLKYDKQEKEQNKQYNQLRNQKTEEEAEDQEVLFSDEEVFLPEYSEMYQENNDLIGWIRIQGTKIDYPVMQSVERPNFYFDHGFDQKKSVYGCPYIAENCDVESPSDNLVIYAHHMNDGTMFSELEKYKKESFWKEHKTIEFDSLTEERTYEVVTAFTTQVYRKDSFEYYQFVDAENEEDFDAFINTCREKAFYDTGVETAYGDQLITLSTCEYSKADSRMVVVAKLME